MISNSQALDDFAATAHHSPLTAHRLERHQFGCCVTPSLFLKAFDELARAGRGKLPGIRAINQSFQALAASEDGADFDLTPVDFDNPARLFMKCAPPASRF